MNSVILSRKQIIQLYEMLVVDYKDESYLRLEISHASGIGADVTAIVKYAAGTREERKDITDYDTW